MILIGTIALNIVKVSKLLQRKLISYRSLIGLGAFQKIFNFGDIARQQIWV